jgi:hypothetical protein
MDRKEGRLVRRYLGDVLGALVPFKNNACSQRRVGEARPLTLLNKKHSTSQSIMLAPTVDLQSVSGNELPPYLRCSA